MLTQHCKTHKEYNIVGALYPYQVTLMGKLSSSEHKNLKEKS